MQNTKTQWFTEYHQQSGSSIGLRIEDKVAERQSEFQKIEIFKTTDFGYLMTIDGCTMVTSRENFLYHEMMSHPALLSHPAPKKVVIIGGGDCGTLREVLKHSEVEKAYQIDIDPVVTELAQIYFPELCASNSDPRADIRFADGIQFMRDAEPASFDIVIVDSTDPIGPGEGLFNHAFYQSCLNALAEGGILVQQSESPLLHADLIKDMREAMLTVGFNDVQTITFPQPIYPSGFWSCTLARKAGQFGQFRVQDAQAFGKDCQYYSAEIHQASFKLPNFLARQLF